MGMVRPHDRTVGSNRNRAIGYPGRVSGGYSLMSLSPAAKFQGQGQGRSIVPAVASK